MLILLAGLICSAVLAQQADTILIKEVKALRTDITKLQKSTKSLSSQLSTLKKAHQEDLKSISGDLDEKSEKIAAIDSRLNELKASLDEHMNASGTKLDNLEKWTKQMAMIQFILFGVLFLILLVLIIVNRQKINKSFINLESKVDNMKESLNLEINQLLNKHEEDIKALKKDLESKKK